MRTPAAALVSTLLAAASPLAAQSLLQNGDFSQGLASWTQSGNGVSAAIESFDVGGFGASSCFGVNASQGAHVLAQVVAIPQGVVYELYAEIAIDAPGFNNEAGIFELRVDGVAIDRYDFGNAPAARVDRSVLCGLFTSANPTTTIEIAAIRNFAGLLGRTPRQRIDNASLEFCPGPSACIRGERWSANPTGNIWLEITSLPGGAFASFLSPGLLPAPLVFPGIDGQLALDLVNLSLFVSGNLDVQGRFRLQLVVPANPALVDVPIYLQAAGTGLASPLGFGIAHNVGVQR